MLIGVALGRVIRITVHPGSECSTCNCPEWSCTIFCAIVKPNPVPFSFPWLTKG